MSATAVPCLAGGHAAGQTMKILLIHNSYKLRGGEDAVFEREAALLRAHGHEVLTYQIENHEIQGGVSTALGAVWNRESCRVLGAMVREHQPVVAHFHNTLPRISPAAYQAVRREGAAVVQTLHNFRMLCPSGILYREGRVCESCLGKAVAYPAAFHRCYRGSLGASATVAVMLTVHGAIGTYERDVDAYIALTEFSRGVFVRGGLPEASIHVKPNFAADPGCVASGGVGAFVLYVGRLVEEKGIRTLLEAWERHAPGVELVIAGDGPLRGEVEAAQARCRGVRYVGAVASGEVPAMMARAAAVVFPSVWYETFGLTLVEAFSVGTPVVASRLGTMESIVQEGVTGMMFEPGNAAALSRCVRAMVGDAGRHAMMRQRVRRVWQERYSPEVNHDRLMGIYEQAIASRHGGGR